LSDNKAESGKLIKFSFSLGYQQRKTVAHVLNMRGTFKQVYVESSQDEAKAGEADFLRMNSKRSKARQTLQNEPEAKRSQVQPP
jgi:hypothetical protein